MKKPVFVLLAVLTLLPCAGLLSQTPPAAPVPDTEQFLETLAGGQPQAPGDQVPAPLFRTDCTSTGCPTGQLCCMLCGNPPDEGSCMGCVTPVRGRCPMVV